MELHRGTGLECLNIVPKLVEHAKATMKNQEEKFGMGLSLILSEEGELSEDSLEFIRGNLTKARHYQELQEAHPAFVTQAQSMFESLACKF